MALSERLGVTVYGCERDEARLFGELSPRFGVVPVISLDALSEATVISIPGNRCVSVGHQSEISRPVMRALQAAGVEYVSTRSIGFDHIDLDAAEEFGVRVENVVYAPDGVADYTLMLILMAIRNAIGIIRSVAGRDFRLSPARSKDLRDMTVGVVGVGNIGTAVIRRLQGFGCRVLAHNNGRPVTAGAQLVALDQLLLESDIVTLHTPLATETHHLLGRDQIAMMKPGAFVINTGRGALVDTAALVAALESGHLGGAALDVLEGEDGVFYEDWTARPLEHRFLARLQQLPNVVVTPHTAYFTERALHDTVEGTLANCLRFERSRTHDQTEDRDLVRGLL